MRIRHNGSRVDLTDTPVTYWIAGAAMIFGSAIFVAMMPRIPRLGIKLFAGAMGLFGMAMGTGVAIRAPRSRLTIDRDRGRVTLDQWSIRGRSHLEMALLSIVAVQLAEQYDEEGFTAYRIQLAIAESAPILFSPIWRNGKKRMEGIATQLAASIGVPSVNAGRHAPIASNAPKFLLNSDSQ